MTSSGSIRHTEGMPLSFGRASQAATLAAASFAIWAPLPGADRVTITFERAAPGTLPRPFLPLSSQKAEPGHWEVTRLGEEPVLSQTVVGGGGYRLAALERPQIEHVRLGVRLQVAERGDRAAGVAWRVRDAENYYAARIDFKEREVVLHKFVGGNRIRLAKLDGIRLPPDAWHELVVEHSGETIRVWLNGIPVATERDRSVRGPGMIALWMPGDSSCHFSRLWYEPLERD